MPLKPGVTGTAQFSDDGRCRWNLKRTWDPRRGFVLYTGLNPSRAGADIDDMTVTKGIGFANVWGFGGTMHGNAYPFITPYPKNLSQCTAEEIEKNDQELLEMAKAATLVVLAWGAFPKFKERFWAVSRLLAPFSPVCVGRTKGGYPQHISRIGYDTRREPWKGTGS
jgi:hypothetical protein